MLCPHTQATHPSSRRRGSSCVSCPYLHQTPGCSCFHSLQYSFLCWTRPLNTSLLLGMLADLARGKAELVAENALLRQQLIILRRQSKRPMCTKRDRSLLVLLARATRSWRQALLIVQEDDPFAMAPSGLSSFLEAQVESDFA